MHSRALRGNPKVIHHKEVRIAMTTYGVLSTFPPTQCGLATFSASLLRPLTSGGTGGYGAVVRVLDEEAPNRPPGVVAELRNGTPDGPADAAAALNAFDVAIIQHEYGIYGGADGAEVVDVLLRLTIPSIIVLHTVLSQPTPHQREVLERAVAAADATVVLSETAARRLVDVYRVDPARVSVIPHGATLSGPRPPSELHALRPAHRGDEGGEEPAPPVPTVLTWGLIGPGKGIEWGVDAVAELDDLPTPPRYVIAGRTHPKVLARSGEAYRDGLRDRAAARGVADRVVFDGTYREGPALQDLVRQADVVLLPYDSTDQVTSGVLIEAVAALKPVVATRFPHATELLSAGAGLLVPQQDPVAMAAALRTLLTRPDVAAGMTRVAGVAAPDLQWAAVAEHYLDLAARLISARVAA
jgi:polysaccharide biosynthesis protein PslF